MSFLSCTSPRSLSSGGPPCLRYPVWYMILVSKGLLCVSSGVLHAASPSRALVRPSALVLCLCALTCISRCTVVEVCSVALGCSYWVLFCLVRWYYSPFVLCGLQVFQLFSLKFSSCRRGVCSRPNTCDGRHVFRCLLVLPMLNRFVLAPLFVGENFTSPSSFFDT